MSSILPFPNYGDSLFVRTNQIIFLFTFLSLFTLAHEVSAQRCASDQLTIRTTADGESIATACSSEVSEVIFANEFTSPVGMGSFTYQWQYLAADFSEWVSISGANEATYTPSLESLPNPEGLSLYRVYVTADNSTPEDRTDDCWQYSSAAAGLSINNNACSRLPVEWRSFGATAGAKKVVLQWETTHEPANAGFHIERSHEGLDWNVIGEQAPLSDNVYDFIDEAPMAGDNYYRIHQTDFDGTITYSAVEVITFTADTRISVFPNPVTDAFTVLLPSAFGDNAELSLFDATGREMSVKTLSASAGIRIETGGLIPGLYLLRATSRDGKIRETVRVVR
ncbi:T9SS type A sorting domain-containing protein [Neolewinella agarilytica]|uniref:Por secretion system C-terminal sorting domain-containing protein n=1 Tax=Neolewinella agarilytica TaxID=478744 RepID=A0A1H8ZC95_9BACT|nr:T9SS type A sorting domain-containing protein [Neolewinella agarilytica]SEP62026.1 Por secretion system C-terminal sorting domain-containing protein [Neolewinella agarilytica]